MEATTALDLAACAFADPAAVAARLKSDGVRVIRTLGSDAPFTWLRAAGFAPVRLVASDTRDTPNADAVMGPATGRRRAHCLLEQLLEPVFDDALLITRVDAEQAQIFAALRERARLGEAAPRAFHMLDLVHQPRAASARYNAARLARLDVWLGDLGGNAVSDDSLARAADDEDATLTLFAELKSLAADDTRVSGCEMLHLIGCSAILPPAELAKILHAVIQGYHALPPRTGRRILVCGSAHEHDAFYRAIEHDGSTIVAHDHDWGTPRLAAPPRTRAQAADPLWQAPLAARWPREDAVQIAQRAIAATVEQALHLTIDRDEAAPWQVAPLRDALPGTIALHVDRVGDAQPSAAPRAPVPTRKPAPAAAAPRSRKSLASLASFGSYQRDWFQGLRAQVAGGAPFALVNANAPQEILRALGVPFVVNQWWASIVAAKQQTRRYRDLLRAHGYPTDVEAYSAQGLAATFDDDPDAAPWGGLPSPNFVHAVASSDATPGIFGNWSHEADAAPFLYERTVDPRLSISTHWWDDLPERWDEALEAERLDLLEDELKQVIAKVEAATDRRFDPDRFAAVMALVNEQEEYYRRTRDLIARTVPAPISIVDSMPATMVPQWHRGTEWARDAAKAFHDEVAQRVADGAGVVADERVRLMWVGRGLWSETAFYQRWEETHGAVFVWSMYLALAADGYIRRTDRGRDPLRALAARFLTMGDELRMPSWAGPWHVHEAQTHGIDGAVALTDADPFVLRALATAGVPVLELGVDNFAMEAEQAAELEARITRFIEGPASARAAERRGTGA